MSYNLIKIPDPVKVKLKYNPEPYNPSFIFRNKDIDIRIGVYPLSNNILLNDSFLYLYGVKILNKHNNIILFPKYIIFPDNSYSIKSNKKYYFQDIIEVSNFNDIHEHMPNNKFIFQYKNKIVVGCDKKWIIN